jgi:hypothetical protein
MSEQSQLACRILEETSSEYLVRSQLFDGTPFEVRVPTLKVIPVKDDPLQAGWLMVEVLGRDEKNQKTLIRLPAPSVTLGHNVNVAANQLFNVFTRKIAEE